ncbi:MAG: trypsin-like peptidase domain-containing protein [Pirellulales bacterium]|nr:trypsin-like peptidase domain-containing protein [Pirellulales bacterium]
MLGSTVRSAASLWVVVWAACLPLATTAAEQLDLPDLIAKVEPSVVRIDVKGVDGDSLGSGFVVDADGIVATNHHVIAGAKEAVAVFANGETAKVLGTLAMDPKRDIAILKIDKTELPVLKLAGKLPRKGESVVACGAPRGLSFSYSDGIISAIREGKEAAQYIGEEAPGHWLQITAPVSPGNSGGPLVTRSGEVVGANTMASLGIAAQNLNFSISSLDIADVFQKGKNNKLVSLANGASKSKHERAKPKRHDLAVDKIPKEKIEAYVKSAKDSYKDAVLDARKKLASEKKKLTEMKSGRVGNTLAMRAPRGVIIIADRGKQLYQYADDDAKTKTVKKQQEEVRQAEEHFNKIENSKTGLLTYLTKAGPQVELKEVGDIGCVAEIFVTTILDSDEFIASIEDDRLPVAVRGMKAEKLPSGQSIPGRLMYVCAIEPYGYRGAALNIRVLRELPAEDLAKHFEELGITVGSGASQPDTAAKNGSENPVASSAAAPSVPEFRTWSDKTGKYKIEAMFVEKTADKVTLKRRDGKTIMVPLAMLSEEDLDHLKKVQQAK